VELLQGELAGLDPATNNVQLENGEHYAASWLSLNLGSQPLAPDSTESSLALLPVKPFAAFLEGWKEWQKNPQPLAILGGGAAGVELALALARQVPQLTLISNARLLNGHPPALRRRALRHLAAAGVQVVEDMAVDALQGDCLLAGGQVAWRGARVILATGASAFGWLRESGLATDQRGFIRIGQTLQSLSHPHVFAVGDCASLPATPRSGVYAVRQGPVLAANLRAALSNQPLQDYQPQHKALALLADGQGGALLSWSGLTAEGKWLGWWKDRLDRSFMQLHGADC
jgi:NADH dehydrogenase FAD-containing subunit